MLCNYFKLDSGFSVYKPNTQILITRCGVMQKSLSKIIHLTYLTQKTQLSLALRGAAEKLKQESWSQ